MDAVAYHEVYRLARNECSPAQYQLGMEALEQGDMTSARHWLGKAAANEHIGAIEKLEELGPDVSESDAALAQDNEHRFG